MVGSSVLLDNDPKQKATGPTDEPLIDVSSFDGGQHLTWPADQPRHFTGVDAATPHLEPGVAADVDRFRRHRYVSLLFTSRILASVKP
jgi:hypothetical protein